MAAASTNTAFATMLSLFQSPTFVAAVTCVGTSAAILCFQHYNARRSNTATADELIERYQLAPHEEGGHFAVIYSSAMSITRTSSALISSAWTVYPRALCTAIYYLLRHAESSRLHRILSEELWIHISGQSLVVSFIRDDNAAAVQTRLGPVTDPLAVQFMFVPANCWFGAHALCEDGEYCLVSCVVPGSFQYAEFQVANREDLLTLYPQHTHIIHRLTPETSDV